MIDREQNLRLGDARKLSQMMQGESVPSLPGFPNRWQKNCSPRI